jgi:hypothetical protein
MLNYQRVVFRGFQVVYLFRVATTHQLRIPIKRYFTRKNHGSLDCLEGRASSKFVYTLW